MIFVLVVKYYLYICKRIHNDIPIPLFFRNNQNTNHTMKINATFPKVAVGCYPFLGNVLGFYVPTNCNSTVPSKQFI